MSAQDWRPSAEIESLKARSRLISKLRAFFLSREYYEVETPVLNTSGTLDPNIESFCVQPQELLLHTSPEFAMKRLLAAGSGAIFQICKVFREEECGRLHNPEFTLLEWYRPGFDHLQLMAEVEALLDELGIKNNDQCCERLTYAQAFQEHLKIDIHKASINELSHCAGQHGITMQSSLESCDQWLDLLMGEIIAPRLGQDIPVFIYDYPESQAALARIRHGNPPVAERFELYWKGIELANGFHELSNAVEQRGRFNKELELRKLQGKRTPRVDNLLLAALEEGLPDCAGVALGIDRLLMLILNKSSIAEVMAFPQDRI